MKNISSDDILDRLKTALSIKNDTELGTKLGVSKAAISNWRKRNSVDYSLVFSFCEHISIDWLITGKGSMQPSRLVHDASYSDENVGVPLIPVEAMAGFFTGEVLIDERNCERLNIPGLKADFVVPVSGDSMEPKYFSGDMVACQMVYLSDLFFQWGKVYVIDTNQGVLIKKVKKSLSSDCITLISVNPEYDNIELPRSNIHHIALVKALVRIV